MVGGLCSPWADQLVDHGLREGMPKVQADLSPTWRWAGIGTTGSWSSGRGTLGGRPRRRLVASILPFMNS